MWVGWMDAPCNIGKSRGVPGRADETVLDPIFRAVLVVCVMFVAGLVPFLLPFMESTSTQAEIVEEILAPEATMLSWVPKNDTETKTYVIDNYTVTLSTHVHKNRERVAYLRVQAPSGASMSIYGQVGYPIPSASFGVGKLDPKSDSKQVIMTSYSGGLHCCTKITVLELVEGKWRKIQLGLWDGDPLPEFPSDVDGDGTPDFVLKDDRFDYAFAPYTERHKPPRIFNIEGGKVVEVGDEARYNPLYEQDMKRAHAGCVKRKNAACAAFVANASRLGKRGWAWAIMLKHYRRSTDWHFPEKCRVPKVNDLCPPGQSDQFREYPEALAWFLADTGYAKQ
jgi:hypothetical protein